jgi:hypothetical protein
MRLTRGGHLESTYVGTSGSASERIAVVTASTSRQLPESSIPMATYTHSHFDQIAGAIGVGASQVAKHEAQFDGAALWYRLNRGRPTRIPPSKLRDKLDRVAKSARRLLTTLGVNDPDEAADGPGDAEILHALMLLGESNEDPVIEAGNPGDDAVNDWIAGMMSLYRMITEQEPATSVGAPGQPNEGIATGPLIRFLEAAGKPIQIEFSEDAWRSRVRTILKGAPE